MKLRKIKWYVPTICILMGIILGVFLELPTFARKKLIDKAQSLGVQIISENPKINFDGLTFKNISGKSEYFPGDTFKISELAISPTLEIKIIGMRVLINGKFEEKLKQKQIWEEKYARKSVSNNNRQQKISIKDASVIWDEIDGASSTLIAEHYELLLNQNIYVNIPNIDIENKDFYLSINGIKNDVSNVTIASIEDTQFNLPTINKSQEPTGQIERKNGFQFLDKYNFKINKIHISAELPDRVEISLQNSKIKSEARVLNFSTERGEVQRKELHANWEKIQGSFKAESPEASAILEIANLNVNQPSIAKENINIPTLNVGVHYNSKISQEYSMLMDIKIQETIFQIFAKEHFESLEVDVPNVQCQDLLNSIPKNIIPKIANIKASGDFEAMLRLDLREKEPEVKLDLQNHCKIDRNSVPNEFDVKRLREKFTYTGYLDWQQDDSLAKSIEIKTGPGTKGWVPLDRMSPFLEYAARTTEDPGFRGSNGFSRVAIENSIRDDLMRDKFFRGGSTISQQLVKNIWLTREKTISRKIQEAILTTYLEQNFSKDEILETYFNVVEFGPGVFGISDAAFRYFHTDPSALTLSQALYLVSLLPHPKYVNADSSGKITKKYMDYLYSLMKIMKDRGTINDKEYEIGKNEWVVLNTPSPELIDKRGTQVEINDWQ